MVSIVKKGDSVKVHYTGKLDDNTIFDSSENREPLSFEVGAGNVIPGFENGIIGMAVGEKKTISIPPEEAYGQPREEMIAKVDKKNFPENIVPEIGQKLQLQQPDNSTINVVIVDIQGDEVTLDANHPLAGKTLIFDLELVSIN